MTIHLNCRVIRSADPVTAPIEDEMVMADVDKGKYYGFDNIATDIWNRLEKEITVADLCRQLTEEYNVPAEQCSADVIEFLEDLAKRNLVSVINSKTVFAHPKGRA